MFDLLQIEWQHRRTVDRLWSMTGSFFFHALLIGTAVATSRGHPSSHRAVSVGDTVHVVYLAEPRRHQAGMPVAPTPLAIPDWLPRVTQGVPFVPPEFPVEVPGTLLTGPQSLGAAVVSSGQSVARDVALAYDAVVDDPPELLAAPAVRYPPLLREGGIGGSVVLEFVVDTLGRVVPTSLRIVTATHTAFEAAARDAVLAAIFRPGRSHGHRVPVQVEQTVTFRVGR